MNGNAHILYIDDDEGLRRLAERALSRRGYHVTLAASGPEGVERAAAGDIDLIAVDHYMPGQDGLQTLEAIRRLPFPPPVVYVTGSEESRIAVAALKAGAADYVVKTVGDEFFDLLSNAFEQALAKVSLQSAKEAAEAELRASNARLEALLREVNHRVSNSLQIVTAFVQMQAGALTDEAAKAALTDTQRRIQAIAQVHKRLYTGADVDLVAMDDYLAALVRELEGTWSTPAAPRRLSLSCDPVKLKTDKAVSLGIIVNELVSNACKYAYEDGALGEVRIAFADCGSGRFRLTVEDDGCGMPDGKVVKGTGLGTKLINAMASSLDTRIAYRTGPSGVQAVLEAAY